MIEIREMPPKLDSALISDLQSLEFPTIGHFVDKGVSSEIRAMITPVKLVGRAITVKIQAPDTVLVHKVTEMIEPGDIVIIDTGGDRTHAPVGDTVAFAMQVRGALGVVIDGVCTDIQGLRDLNFPVFARGTSLTTTRLHGLNAGGINVPVSCGGIAVTPGDIVLADDNGVLIMGSTEALDAVDRARASEARHAATIEYLREGGSLADRTSANRLLSELL